MEKFIAYYRVSTISQGNSGLGLEAQKNTIYNYLRGAAPIMEFMDVESGTKKGNDRTGLFEALAYCKENNGKLIISKLDRLSRNSVFIGQLLESNVDLIICDLPSADRFTLHIFAALAEKEAQYISERTKAALTELRKRGIKLGSPQNLTSDARYKGTVALKRKALENVNNQQAIALILQLKKENWSYRKIATKLNESCHRTSTGKNFSGSQVLVLYDRYLNSIEDLAVS